MPSYSKRYFDVLFCVFQINLNKGLLIRLLIKIKVSMTCKYQEYSIKMKCYGSYEHSLKWSFYQVIISFYKLWKLLYSEGEKTFWRGVYWHQSFSWYFLRISQFFASEWKLSSILLVRKTLQFLRNMSPNLKTLYSWFTMQIFF